MTCHPRLLRIGVGLFGVILLLWLVDATAVARLVSAASPPWLLAASVLLTAVTVLGAVNAYLFVAPAHSVRFSEFLRIFWVAWAVGLVIPGQVGDVASLSLSLKRRGLPWAVGLGRSLADKLISAAVMGLWAVAGLLRVGGIELAAGAVATAGLLIGLGLMGGALAMRARRVPAVLARTSHALGAALREVGTVAMRHPARVAVNVLLTFVKVVLTGVGYWCVFSALSGPPSVSVVEVIALVAASALVAYLPVSANGLGTVEAAGLALFASVGLAADVVLSAYLLLRLLVLALAWAPAALMIASR